jgi:hypothetical protein
MFSVSAFKTSETKYLNWDIKHKNIYYTYDTTWATDANSDNEALPKAIGQRMDGGAPISVQFDVRAIH